MASVAMVVTNACAPDPRVMRSAELLGQKGHTVTIHAFDRTQTAPMSEMVNGVRIMRYHIGSYAYGAKLATVRGLRAFSKVVLSTLQAKPPECVYCHDADTLSIGVKMARQTGCKLIYDMHDLQHTWALMGKPNSLPRRLIANRMERKALRGAKMADLVITSSGSLTGGLHPGFKEYLADNGIESMVVENRPKQGERAQKSATQKSDWTVAYIGRVRELESFQLLTSAIELIAPEQRPSLKIAGDGTAVEPVHAHLLTASSRLGIHLNLSGSFTSETFPTLMQDVDVMYALYPPHRGNITNGALPVKMFDAASYGVPTIVNSDCLMGELASMEAIGVPVAWDKPQELADALLSQRLSVAVLTQLGVEQQNAFVHAFEALF